MEGRGRVAWCKRDLAENKEMRWRDIQASTKYPELGCRQTGRSNMFQRGITWVLLKVPKRCKIGITSTVGSWTLHLWIRPCSKSWWLRISEWLWAPCSWSKWGSDRSVTGRATPQFCLSLKFLIYYYITPPGKQPSIQTHLSLYHYRSQGLIRARAIRSWLQTVWHSMWPTQSNSKGKKERKKNHNCTNGQGKEQWCKCGGEIL